VLDVDPGGAQLVAVVGRPVRQPEVVEAAAPRERQEHRPREDADAAWRRHQRAQVDSHAAARCGHPADGNRRRRSAW